MSDLSNIDLSFQEFIHVCGWWPVGDLRVTLPAKVRMQDPQIRNQQNPGGRSQEEQWDHVDQWPG